MNSTIMMSQNTCYTTKEHEFAQYIRILGKGKTGSRSLTYEEAYAAFSMILKNEVLDIQLGAFLMLLRVKEESIEEITAFVQASKDQIRLPTLDVDLDWSSYAGKRKHYPWYILAALTLARHGYNIVMHGMAGHTSNRLYTEHVVRYLGYSTCQSESDIAAHLSQQHFAYVPLGVISPCLNELMQLRPILGLRSPVHTLVRLLNPLNAKATLQAIFHPAYRPLHQQAAFRLQYRNSAVMKGEGGEFERNPDAKTLICGVKNDTLYELELAKITSERSPIEENFNLDFFKSVWLGQAQHDYGHMAIIETLAIALYVMNQADNYAHALKKAENLWQTRFGSA